MNTVGKPERATQRRVIKLFEDELGYTFLGDWSDRSENSNVEEKYLAAHLKNAGYGDAQINAAIR